MPDISFVREELRITMSKLGLPGPQGIQGPPVDVVVVDTVAQLPATPNPTTFYVVKA